ncbi:MAG: biotin synthase BioB [Halanaerobacter sp.]
MINELRDKVLQGEGITKEEALKLIAVKSDRILELLAAANKIKNEFMSDRVDLCSIINAKSGSCSEDCSFCAQSAHHETEVDNYLLLEEEEILTKAKRMDGQGAEHFGIVTSGRGIETEAEFERILNTVQRIKAETDLDVCASLGTLREEQVNKLAAVGLKRYNHNLETSKNYFSEICSTHDYQERVQTVQFLKRQGIEVCCGGIIGLGEGIEDRVDLAFKLKELDIDSIPLNILNPVAGTPLEGSPPLPPLEALKTTAVFRFINPTKVIKLCGGREKNLRDLQSLSLLAGVNGLLVGNYLTTTGRSVEDDLEMINDLGLTKV